MAQTKQINLDIARQKVSLKSVLMVPFVVQICAAVGLTGWLSWRNGQEAVNNVATQLRHEIVERIDTQLDRYLALPPKINRANANAIDIGILDLKDFTKLGKYFWQQMRLFDVGYINFANEKREFIGVERLDNGELRISEILESRGIDRIYTYTTDEKGNRQGLPTVEQDEQDVRQEGWYISAVKAGKPTWTPIYQWQNRKVLSVSHSHPLYDRQRQLVGAIGVDYILTQVGQFLQSLKVGQSGKTMIVERSGTIVASSTDAQPFIITGSEMKRLHATESKDLLLQATAQHLLEKFGSFDNLPKEQELEFLLSGERQFVEIRNWKDEYGLDWLIVVVVPESDFLGQIYANNLTTLGLCLLALAIAILCGFLVARWIARPLQQLERASDKMAKGEFGQELPTSRIKEISVLATAFDRMSTEIEQSRAQLEDYSRSLEQKVQERTRELQKTNKALQAELARAGQVQADLLPKVIPPLPGFELAARCIPAKEVGGDFYDWQLSSPDLFNFTLGDVMGKGMPAALLMTTVRATLHAIDSQSLPPQTIRKIDSTLESDLMRAESFVTLFQGQLDLAERQLNYVDAGHGHVLIRRADGTLEHLDRGGMPIGILPEQNYQGGSAQLHRGDALLLYSDGLLEVFPPLAKDVNALIEPLKGVDGAADILNRLIGLAPDNGSSLPDDLTVVVLYCRR
jgi:serine phosphatase RsbU (regulator of sigma subunit)